MQAGKRVGVDPDAEREDRAGAARESGTERAAGPAETADLREPARLRDPDIFADAIVEGMVRKRADELVARIETFGGRLRGVEAERLISQTASPDGAPSGQRWG